MTTGGGFRRWCVLFALLPVAATVAATPAPPENASASEDAPEGAETAFDLADAVIAESSGIATSQRHEGIYYTHNDSGTYAPEVYAVNGAGETVATLSIEGAELRDWEAIAVGEDDNGEPAIFIGDIGDNFNGGWPSVRVYRVPEPVNLTDQTLSATMFEFSYADGARNAEAMFINPSDNRLYMVSKELSAGVYAAPEELSSSETNELTRVDSAPLYSTGAAFAPDGSSYTIRTYWNATVYDASEGVPGEALERVTLPEQEQGESLTYTGGGAALLAGSEGVHSPVWRMPLEGIVDAEPSPGEAAGGSGEGAAESTERVSGGVATLIMAGLAVAGVLIAGIVWLARRG